ncbi:GNAT family N-acetyltransferase [Brevibacillus sp. NL20B1]|uniref:GNAT family N-acetyltransferase n=1 Tax=Brevibacillus sp. NL20B1 TaxID=2829799 RepID=UPI0020129C9D|nr:GNAT family N-acetyltransferase [Brevibacillus sp. NL20B1]
MNDLLITKPTREDITSAYAVFEASITDAFEKDGLGHLTSDIEYEIESKKNLLTSSLVNAKSGTFFLVAMGSLYVLPEFQGKGVGSALIHSIMKVLYESGVKQFCLDSGYKQAQSKWLRKFGEPYFIARDYWGKDRHHMVWLCKVSDYVKGQD